MKCNTCKHKEECKANMESMGLPFVRMNEYCTEYEDIRKEAQNE